MAEAHMAIYRPKYSESLIREALEHTPIFDIHEHLLPLDVIHSSRTDFTYLFPNYASTDLLSSGMSEDDLERIRAPGRRLLETLMDGLRHIHKPWVIGESELIDVEKKWDILEPYWNNIRLTGYGRCLRYALEDLFGVEDFNQQTCHSVSEKLVELPKDWRENVLEGKCNIQEVINDVGKLYTEQDPYSRAIRFDHFFRIASKEEVISLEEEYDVSIQSLDNLIDLLESELQIALTTKLLTIKSAIAYERSLKFTHPDIADARQAFETIISLEESEAHPAENQLQDFLMHWISNRAAEISLPIQVHTGLQEGPPNNIRNADPILLVDLILSHPNTIYIVMHAGFPFCREYAVLVKTFPNVYADLSWFYMISPSAAKQVLHELLDTVPTNKLLGFGGDSLTVEWVYGQLRIAKEVLCSVLSEKVGQNGLKLKEAIDLSNKLLYQNAEDLFLC